MGKTRIIELTASERLALEKGYRTGKTHSYRKRCQAIVLKSEGRLSFEVGQIVGMHEVSVNKWLNRYEAEGLEGLKTKPGGGRKPILDTEKDAESVRQAVKKERQRLSKAKDIIETELDKGFSLKTLKRFLKNLSADINESA